MAFRVLVDACVLVPMATTDLLLRLAGEKTFHLMWSEDILTEVERSLVTKIRLSPVDARKRLDAMRESFPSAMVDGYDDLIPSMTNDSKDRHVLAAAVRGNAELIVTANINDFPRSACIPYDIDVRTPDDFLTDQLDLYPGRTLKTVREAHAALQSPSMTLDEYLTKLEGCRLNIFTNSVRYLIDTSGLDTSPDDSPD